MKWMLAVVLLAACSSKKSEPPPVAKPVEVTWAPRVSTPNVLAKWSDPPPPVIVIDAAGNGLMSSAATWDALATANPATGAEPLTGETIALLTTRTPPEPPEPRPEDGGEEESGGTGTLVNLEEKPYIPEPLPDQAVIERNKLLEIAGGAPASKRYEQPAAPMPIFKVVGEVMTDGMLIQPSAVIVAAPTAKAATLVDLVVMTKAALGVVHEGKVRPLRIDFAERRDRIHQGRRWLEVRVGIKGVAIELVPDAPRRAEPGTLIATLDQLRKDLTLDPRTRVDVLVEPDVDVQRLVDVLVTLDQASVLVLGVGHAPAADSAQAKQRGARRPTLWFGQPNAQGDLDKAIIRDVVRAQHVALSECHTKQLAKNPALDGTVQTQFFITPDGKVASSNASGLDAEVTTCVQKVIKALEFPKPKGGGGVQVNYPLTFRR